MRNIKSEEIEPVLGSKTSSLRTSGISGFQLHVPHVKLMYDIYTVLTVAVQELSCCITLVFIEYCTKKIMYMSAPEEKKLVLFSSESWFFHNKKIGDTVR